jgi:DNA modification methylase
MDLLQDKLDARLKKRANLFNWRGQFTPEFVAYMIDQFTQKGDLIIDPFSGSGTTLQEAILKNRAAEGFEINLSAYAMSKFFTFATDEIAFRWTLINNFELKLNALLKPLNGQLVYTDSIDYRTAYFDLLRIGKEFIPFLDKKEKIIWLNILFLSERDKKMTLKQSIQKSFAYIKNALLGLPFSENTVKAHLKDARTVGDIYKNKVDFILTSPPYINVFNYHQNYRAIVELFNFDILKVANSEFGSNRKNRGNRFKTVIQYSIDMEQAICSFGNALKIAAPMVLILGRQSNVRNTTFLNGQIVADIIKGISGFGEVSILERKFVNKFGVDIKEDILVARKLREIQPTANAKYIALRHLEANLLQAQGEIRYDLEEAIKALDTIKPSPLFNPAEITVNA